jgi:hypothetical protein
LLLAPPRFELLFRDPPRLLLLPPRFELLFRDEPPRLDEAREPIPEPRALLFRPPDFRLEPDRFDDEPPRPDEPDRLPDERERFPDDFLPVAMCVLLCRRVCMNASQDSRTLREMQACCANRCATRIARRVLTRRR